MKFCDVPYCKRPVSAVLCAHDGERFNFCAIHSGEYRRSGYVPAEPDQLELAREDVRDDELG